MRRRAQLYSVIAVVAMPVTIGMRATECRADTTIASIVADDGGKFTLGILTFTFNADSVTSDQFSNNYTPTAANIVVTAVTGGVNFSLSPMATLTGATSTTDKITINYTVTSTTALATAGLSFGGYASGVDASSSTTETLTGDANQTLNVFTMATDDMQANNNNQNNQSVALPDNTLNLSVSDVGTLSIPNRGGGGSSDTQITSIVNTFTVPEPSTFVLAAIATAVGLRAWRRGQKRKGN